MALSAALAAWLCVPAAATVARAPAPSVLPPLAVLAPALTAALAAPAARPSLPTPAVSAALPRPASLDTARAAVLLDRARATATAAPAVAAKAAASDAQAAPAKVLEAVNSVLKEVSPERLAAMSDAELHSVGGLILDALSGTAARPDTEAVRTLSWVSAARLRAPARSGLSERSLFKPGDERHEEQIEVRGVPPSARWTTTDGSEVFRHYTTDEGARAIAAGAGLWNGFVSYVQRSPGLWRKTFRDLNGVFLTKPGVAGDQVGVPAREFPRYVDVRVPAGLPLVELEPGRIFLIPLPARTRGWMADIYRRWAGGAQVDRHYEKTAREMDQEGGPGPDLAVPASVVGSGAAR